MPNPLFRTKFCGLTRLEDVDSTIACQVEAIGLNLYPPSPRSVSIDRAIELAERVNHRCKLVCVLVDPTLEQVLSICSKIPIDYLQLHGDEDPAAFGDPSIPPILKAIAWRGERDVTTVMRWRTAVGIRLAGFLVDAYDPILKGGSGKKARWDLLIPRPACLNGIPLILAGGLVPDNVAQAIELVRPEGVDCASGIESEPGIKSEPLMFAFSRAAKSAFERE